MNAVQHVYLAIGLEVGLDVVDGGRRRQTTHKHLLGARHHLQQDTVTPHTHALKIKSNVATILKKYHVDALSDN